MFPQNKMLCGLLVISLTTFSVCSSVKKMTFKEATAPVSGVPVVVKKLQLRYNFTPDIEDSLRRIEEGRNELIKELEGLEVEMLVDVYSMIIAHYDTLKTQPKLMVLTKKLKEKYNLQKMDGLKKIDAGVASFKKHPSYQALNKDKKQDVHATVARANRCRSINSIATPIRDGAAIPAFK